MPRARWMSLGLVAGYAGVALLRLGLVAMAPAETTDVLRNLLYGRSFWDLGYRVYDLVPGSLPAGDGLAGLWGTHTYDYPVFTLFFFALVGRFTTSWMWAKLLLSALELLNALLVARLTGSRATGLLYFASPASLWWVSREGQFEPLAVLFMLLALRSLESGEAVAAWAWLAVAVQVKLFPLLLLPWFLWKLRSGRGCVAFGLAFLPSLAASLGSSYLARMFEPGYWPQGFNPFAWDFVTRSCTGWVPRRLVWANALVTGFLLVVPIARIARALARRDLSAAAALVPLLGFLVVLKSMSWVEFWYLLLVPAFAQAAPERRIRIALTVAASLEARALGALLAGPAGAHQWFPMDAFMYGW